MTTHRMIYFLKRCHGYTVRKGHQELFVKVAFAIQELARIYEVQIIFSKFNDYLVRAEIPSMRELDSFLNLLLEIILALETPKTPADCPPGMRCINGHCA